MALLNKTILHKIFRISILIKGIDSFFEIIGGFLLLFINPSFINNFVKLIFQHELLQDPRDFIGNLIINLSSSLSVKIQFFGAIYLLSHGIIKMVLIIGLWKKKLWTYFAAEIVFAMFIIYQVYRYTFTHSIFLILLTLLDIIIIFLTWLEYKQLRETNR
jgi:uncharacterized membrane protein